MNGAIKGNMGNIKFVATKTQNNEHKIRDLNGT